MAKAQMSAAEQTERQNEIGKVLAHTMRLTAKLREQLRVEWSVAEVLKLISSVKNPANGSFQASKWEMLQRLGTDHLVEWDRLFTLLKEEPDGTTVSTLEVASLCILANRSMDAHSKFKTLLRLFDWSDAEVCTEADLVLAVQTALSALRKGMRKFVADGGAKVTLPGPSELKEACRELLFAATGGKSAASSHEKLFTSVSNCLESFCYVLDLFSLSDGCSSGPEDRDGPVVDGDERAASGASVKGDSSSTPENVGNYWLVKRATEASRKIGFFERWLSWRRLEMPKTLKTPTGLERAQPVGPVRQWLQYALDTKRSPREDEGKTTLEDDAPMPLQVQLRLAWLHRSAALSSLKAAYARNRVDDAAAYYPGAALVCIEVLRSVCRGVASSVSEGKVLMVLRDAIAASSEEATSLWRRLWETYRGGHLAKDRKTALLLDGAIEACELVEAGDRTISEQQVLKEVARAVIDASIKIRQQFHDEADGRTAMDARARGLELAIAKLEGLCHRATEDTSGSHLGEWIQDEIEDILPCVGGQQCNVRERVLQTFNRIRADEKTMLEGALASLTVIGEEVRRMTEGGLARVDQEGDDQMQKIEAACSSVAIECSLDAALDEAPTSSLPVSAATAFGFGPDAFSLNPFKVVAVLEEMLTRIEGLSGLELEDAIQKLESFDMDGGHDASDNDSRRKRFAIRAKQSACASGWPSSEGFEKELEELRQLPAKMGDVWKTAVDDLANVLRDSDAHLSEDPAVRARRHVRGRLCRIYRVVYELTASGVLTEPLHPIEDPRLDASIPLSLRGAGSPRAIFDSERRLRCGRHAQMAWFVGALNVSALRENESLDNPLSADSVSCCAGEAGVLQALCERKLMDLLASHRGSVEEMQDNKITALQQFIRDCIAEDLRRSEVLPSSVRKTLLRAASESEVYEVAAPPELHEWEREAPSTAAFNTIERPDRRSSIWALALALYGSDDDDRLVGEFATALRWWVMAISKHVEFSLVLAAARLETGGSEKNGDWPGSVIRGRVDEAVLRYMEIATLRGPVMKRIVEANREKLVEIAVVECQYSLESIYTQDAEYLDIEEIERLQEKMRDSFKAGVENHRRKLIRRIVSESFPRSGPFAPADVVQQVLDGTRTSVDFAISRILGDVDEVPCDLRDDPFDAEVARWIGSMVALEAAKEALGVVRLDSLSQAPAVAERIA
ncbi:hypothetical protein FOZ62_025124 [Perkinsus olseni]|uniref:Uncharacterized protein n=1 Tax=Perkinsus olseni TaxID=32597 RepID=A0A7J6T080_PEROL|nr:hypothetical protein FOZ62_025124 [Perkinsus olseni]